MLVPAIKRTKLADSMTMIMIITAPVIFRSNASGGRPVNMPVKAASQMLPQ